ncbi:amidase [Agrobacterium rubi]|nr:amidase [Agrobacterium rubi]NTF29902.1 amidase [Agrobacterium rubi]
MELSLAFRTGSTTPTLVTELFLDKIERAKSDSIFITVTADRALAEARAADLRYKTGSPLSLLDGVPVAWKDLFDITGTVTTAGSRVSERRIVSSKDSVSVFNLCAAGLVTLGKVNTSEFAYSGLGINSNFGTPRNPHDRLSLRSPGGSSSGSGAAVAAGLTTCAIGTDTGGSIRIPAAFNGVVGFKTSTGKIDKNGVVPLSRTLDTVGPLARSVEDCVLLYCYLQGVAVPMIKRRRLTDLVVVSPTNIVLEGAEHAVAENYEASLKALEDNGVTVRRENVSALDQILEMTAEHGNLVAAEAYAEYRALIEGPEVDLIDRRVVQRMLGGKKMTANDVLTIQRKRRCLEAEVRTQLQGALLVMPTSPLTAPEVAPLEANDELFHTINQKTLRNASFGNVLDLCAVAMPNGRNHAGLPTSFLLSACHGDDENLLSYALEVERVFKTCGLST